MNITTLLILIVAKALPLLMINVYIFIKYMLSYIYSNIYYNIYILKSGQSLYIQSIGSSIRRYNGLLQHTIFNLKQSINDYLNFKYKNENKW
jgi:hypothetical protein